MRSTRRPRAGPHIRRSRRTVSPVTNTRPIVVQQQQFLDNLAAFEGPPGSPYTPRPDWTATNDRLVRDALLDLLALGRDGAFLIFIADEYYVQFYKDIENNRLLCEASSGRYLPAESPQLPPDAARQLL